MRHRTLPGSRDDLMGDGATTTPTVILVAPDGAAWRELVAQREQIRAEQIHVIAVPRVVRRAVSLTGRGSVDRQMRLRFALRAVLDRYAARQLRRTAKTKTACTVYAVSFAARRSFAAAQNANAQTRTVLIEDRPDIRQLHDDLDVATRAHPDAALLHRYRAPRAHIAHQHAERALAHALLVRSVFARDARITMGHDPDAVELFGAIVEPPPQEPRAPTATPRVLLAGPAAARHGTHVALAALGLLPNVTLCIQPGEWLEPTTALAHPRVVASTPDERATLRGIDVVIAPTWCEAALPEVTLAARRGVALVCTDRAAPNTAGTPIGEIVAPNDASALAEAINAALAATTAAAKPNTA